MFYMSNENLLNKKKLFAIEKDKAKYVKKYNEEIEITIQNKKRKAISIKYPDKNKYSGNFNNKQATGFLSIPFNNGILECEYTTNDGEKPIVHAFKKFKDTNGNIFMSNDNNNDQLRYAHYRYINGEEYRGQTGEGFGIVITNKYTYTGDVKEKRANGCGRAIFNDGVIYEGELKNGVTDGVGMLISQDEIYAGEFKDGKKHGIGFVTNKNNQTTTEYYCKGEKVIDLQSARLADTISKISSNHK